MRKLTITLSKNDLDGKWRYKELSRRWSNYSAVDGNWRRKDEPITQADRKPLWEDRCLELLNEGLSYCQIADKLAEYGFVSAQKRRLDSQRIANRIWYLRKKAKGRK